MTQHHGTPPYEARHKEFRRMFENGCIVFYKQGLQNLEVAAFERKNRRFGDFGNLESMVLTIALCQSKYSKILGVVGW